MIEMPSSDIPALSSHGSLSLYITAILIVALAGMTTSKIYKWFQRYKFFRSFPSLEYSYLYGNLHLISDNDKHNDVMIHRVPREVDPKMACLWMGPLKGEMFLYHPKTVKPVLMSSAAWRSLGFSKAFEPAVPWVGDGVVTSNGDKWYRARKLIVPAFHLGLMKDCVPKLNQCADGLLDIIDGYAKSGESVDIVPLMARCALEMVYWTLMGSQKIVQKYDGQFPYLTATGEMARIWVKRVWNPLLWPTWVFRRTSIGKTFFEHCDAVHKMSEDLIEARKQKLNAGFIPDTKRQIFLDTLLLARDEDGQPMSDKAVRNQVDTILFAANDTTTSSLIFNVYNLAKHQDYQTKVKDELDGVLDGRGSDDLLWDDFGNLKTLDLCSKESKRLYPPGRNINRTLVKDLEIDGKVIPAGTDLLISIIAMHRHPDLWDKPDEYVPERFLTDDWNKDAYMPFSAGPRNCFGQTFSLYIEKVILSRIFRRYNVTLDLNHEVKIDPKSLVAKPANGIKVIFKKRKTVDC